jgi:hypothetical protein
MALGLAAAAGLGAIGTVLGTAATIKGNEDALKAQKKAAELELKQAKQRAKIEDRQTVKSIALADRQTVANQALSDRQAVANQALNDRQAVAAIEIADRQQLAAFALIEQQSAAAAAEDRLALQSELATSNLNSQARATEIRRNLMATLGTQRATLAARGVGSGSLPGLFEDDARSAATDDTNANTINRLQGEADAAAGNRSITSSLGNLRNSNLLTAIQSREGALTTLANDREGAAQNLSQSREGAGLQLSQIRERSNAELAMMRESTKVDLKNREASTKLGIQSAKDQTRYANTAALISGFTQIASLGYSYASRTAEIEPGPRGIQVTRQPVQYTPPRQLAVSQASRAGF